MILFHKEYGQGKPLVILHGLFGFSDNWNSHAKYFSSYFRVILFDLRNHGKSSWDSQHTYEAMAHDVVESLNHLEIENAHFIGHSMGGKVIMHLAQMYGGYIDKMIVVDMGIKAYPKHHQQIIDAIRSVPINEITARSQVNIILKPMITKEGLRQFLLKNLYWKEKGVLAWRMNVDVLEANMDEVLSALPSAEILHETLFIRGELSNYILNEDLNAIELQFPDSQVKTIEGAGHWIHADAPDEFSKITLSYFLR